jgi:hypothetical protein
MKKIGFLAILSLLLACDDGEFNIPSFDFDGLTIKNCGNTVFNKITSSGTESLILQIDVNNADDELFKNSIDSVMVTVSPSASNTMYYRIFNGSITSDYFCQEVPPSTPLVTSEWFGEGTLYLSNQLVHDDNDGVPAEIEKVLDANTGLLLDTDKDGYPNYIDIDDDGDGELTSNENSDIIAGVLVANEIIENVDTDEDGIPNYLDTDDDNDGLLSIVESKTDDQNVNTIPDYLDTEDQKPITAASPVTNTYNYYYSMRFEFSTLTLYNETSTINYPDGYNYGTKTGTFTTSEFLPPTEEEEK